MQLYVAYRFVCFHRARDQHHQPPHNITRHNTQNSTPALDLGNRPRSLKLSAPLSRCGAKSPLSISVSDAILGRALILTSNTLCHIPHIPEGIRQHTKEQSAIMIPFPHQSCDRKRLTLRADFPAVCSSPAHQCRP
jgi:hypothetical protein